MQRYKRMRREEAENLRKIQGNTFVEDIALSKEDFKKKYSEGNKRVKIEEYEKLFERRRKYNMRLV